jgi:hypothetical protein
MHQLQNEQVRLPKRKEKVQIEILHIWSVRIIKKLTQQHVLTVICIVLRPA